MTTRPVLTNPNSELRKASTDVPNSDFISDEIQTLIQDLKETMKIENGIGIAAPQIGVHKRVIIIDTGHGAQAFINPVIKSKSFKKISSEEGCLSVPGIYGMVKRSKKVKVNAFAETGEEMNLTAEGLMAIVFQHEVDHLDGILFIDKVTEYTSPPKM